MWRSSAPFSLLLFLPLLLMVEVAGAQPGGREPGLMFVTAMSGSPLSEVAEQNGTYAIPGREQELRLLWVSPRGDGWSVGAIRDSYRLDQVIDISSRSVFTYRSTTASVGYSFARAGGAVPLSYGIDAGWLHYRATSSRPTYYTGEHADTRMRGDAVVLGLSAGVEIPFHSVALVPRLRIATNYPDFGGGEGYSRLHREHDLGLKASAGLGVKGILRRWRG